MSSKQIDNRCEFQGHSTIGQTIRLSIQFGCKNTFGLWRFNRFFQVFFCCYCCWLDAWISNNGIAANIFISHKYAYNGRTNRLHNIFLKHHRITERKWLKNNDQNLYFLCFQIWIFKNTENENVNQFRFGFFLSCSIPIKCQLFAVIGPKQQK